MYTAPFRSQYAMWVTQEFGSTSNNAWYIANGISVPHNGIDLAFGNPRETFGTECICPTEWEYVDVVKVNWDDPHKTKGNGVTVQSPIIDGCIYQLVFWHTCEIKVKIGDRVKSGEVICYVGNSGVCKPERSILRPFDGSHSHFMLFKFVST